jgi:hypothetical protein
MLNFRIASGVCCCTDCRAVDLLLLHLHLTVDALLIQPDKEPVAPRVQTLLARGVASHRPRVDLGQWHLAFTQDGHVLLCFDFDFDFD